jgi:hypothetical protein
MQANAHAGLLVQLVEQLQVPFGYEPSFRLCRGAVLANRCLISLTKADLGDDASARILAVCRRLAMPDGLVKATADNLGGAEFVHFAFEENEQSELYKVYLEFPALAKPPASQLLHLAFKWDIRQPARHVETRYLWHPGLSAAQITARLADIYGAARGESFALASEVVENAAARPGHEISYLEVTEEATGRRSFDLNVYDAGLRVADLEGVLARMCVHFGIDLERFGALYHDIKDQRFGHLAGGVHRQGEDFFNIYYGMRKQGVRAGAGRPARAGWTTETMKSPEHTTEQDQYYNYCWWPYLPVAPTEGKWRAVSLLHQSFEAAGLGEPAGRLVERIQAEIGQFRTVWGAKWLPESPLVTDSRVRLGETASVGFAKPQAGALAWEFYFYDYQRRERQVSATRVLNAIRPLLPCDVQVNEALPYFMFSLDVNREFLSGGRDLDIVHMYIGNPGSRVSSGIAYAVTPTGTTLENFYFFFDAKRDLREAAEKIYCSAHVDASLIDLDRLLIPVLRDCHTICIANKQKNDTVYFSGINVEQLLFFLKMLRYPPALVGFIEDNRGKLDHLLYDVGFDYVARGSTLHFVKSGYYGVF